MASDLEISLRCMRAVQFFILYISNKYTFFFYKRTSNFEAEVERSYFFGNLSLKIY